MSFNQLYRVSEPKRVVRSLTVKGPPLQIDAYRNSMYYGFNFKAHPSTTGSRHRGYVKFSKPRHSSSLGDVPCEVDCDCPDYRFRWAWTNKQKGSGRVGANSMNQAHNRAPRKTNPRGEAGLCKHILAVKAYIEGQTSDADFIGNEPEPDAADMLTKLVDRSKKIWIDYEGHVQRTRDRERQLSRARSMRNRGEEPPSEPPDDEDEEPPDNGGDEPQGNMPPSLPPVPGQEPENPEHEPEITTRDLHRRIPRPPSEPPNLPRSESVDKLGFTKMRNDLEKAQSIVQEMEADIEASGFENSVTGDCPEEEKPPGEQALDLLKSIDTSLKALAGEDEVPGDDVDPDAATDLDDLPPEGDLDFDGGEEFEDEEDPNKLKGI
jgi:hypothetical protein